MVRPPSGPQVAPRQGGKERSKENGTAHRPKLLRIRADSMGSTRGAFTHISKVQNQEQEIQAEQQPVKKSKSSKNNAKHHQKSNFLKGNETNLNFDDNSDGSDQIYENRRSSLNFSQSFTDIVPSPYDLENAKYNSITNNMEGIPSKLYSMHNGDEYEGFEKKSWFSFREHDQPLIAYTLQSLFYDPSNPEFTTLQQIVWACVLGVFMGIFTAVWGEIIEWGVELTWKQIPEYLLEIGVFTDLDGHLPLPYYMVICPSIMGGALAYITAIQINPIPGQNEWIESLHRIGIMDHTTFLQIIAISTLGMMSGLSLGPELPLVLTAGMVGSYLALQARQSVLSARVMNLTAASAAIGGFFGFPMAGALFVLEIPHRMGLQYFEALTPATIASIIAVITNRIWTKNDVTGYFDYPFLVQKLPSHIFYIAIVYGLVGCVFGVFYSEGVLKCKTVVHDWFHYHEHDHEEEHHHDIHHWNNENVPLVGNATLKMKTIQDDTMFNRVGNFCQKMNNITIKNEPKRAAVAGLIAGALTGLISMWFPHALFWGEAQLQTLIDNGKTPLPIFGLEGEPTADLTAYGYCMVKNPENYGVGGGFGMGCSAILTFTKVLTIGLSLGTGVVGGHFWGPLYVGAAASNFFVGLMYWIFETTGYGQVFSTFPTVAVLCIMGSCHVVTFRAHTAIMLILTLTISAFSPDNGSNADVAGDYSAVFPLLVISVTFSLLFSRRSVFYKKQRSRGDIQATPDVLCEPNKEGEVLYDDDLNNDLSSYDNISLMDSEDSMEADCPSGNNLDPSPTFKVPSIVTQEDIEIEFLTNGGTVPQESKEPNFQMHPQDNNMYQFPTQPPPPSAASSSIDALLAKTSHELNKTVAKTSTNKHRRHKSGSSVSNSVFSNNHQSRIRSYTGDSSQGRRRRSHSRDHSIISQESRSTPVVLSRVSSFSDQPSLLDQGRIAKNNNFGKGRRDGPPKQQKPQHRRVPSSGASSARSSILGGVGPGGDAAGAMPQDDIERAFSNTLNEAYMEYDPMVGSQVVTKKKSKSKSKKRG